MKINFIVVCIALILPWVYPVRYSSSYNKDKVREAYIDDVVSLPIIVSSPLERKYCQAMTKNLNVSKHELRDSDYIPNVENLDQNQQRILFNEEPPLSVFDIHRVTIDEYQVLEIKDFRIILINPTKNFRFCVTKIFSDSETIKRIEHKHFPFCLNAYNKYPFYFQFYLTQFKPKLLFRAVIYFYIDIYQKGVFVGNKIWPRQVYVKVNQNYLKLAPFQAKNCGKNFTTLTIANHQPHHIKINFDSEQETQQKGIMRQVMIPSQKSFKMTIMPKERIIAISGRAFQLPDIKFPKLFLPIYCLQPLDIDHFNVGILNSERSVSQMPLLVTSHSKQKIQIVNIEVQSPSETVDISAVQGNTHLIEPGQSHKLIGKLIFYLNKEPVEKSNFTVRITYTLNSNEKQLLVIENTNHYYEFKNPFAFGSKRFIDVNAKLKDKNNPNRPGRNQYKQNLFPIKNNLNIPLQLTNVIYDNEIFKVTWLKEFKTFIYPNHQKDQFVFEYLGPLQISISPIKFVITLQFNGKLYISIEIVVYDQTLQCVYNNIQQKCKNLPPVDFGYFRTNSTKFKQIVIRNWNPTPMEIQLQLLDGFTNKFGMNCTVSIFGPFPNYQLANKHNNTSLFYYLKGGHFIIINLAITPLQNATSGETNFKMATSQQQISTTIKFRIENATIALIPQVLWINSAYQRSIQYLNLVSTFSESYKIKSASVNVSSINIFFNNDSQIFQNQWIGLALIYEPFTKTNFTESCCGNQFAVNYFINSLYITENKKTTYATVRVTTTTDLETNSTVIIDNTPPKLISQQNITLRLMNTKYHYPANILLKNIFNQPLKFSLILTPSYLYQDSKQYMSTMRRNRKTYQDAMLCVNNGITVAHNFSPQMVKNLFNLDSIPQQVTIEPLGNAQYYVGSQRKSSLGTSSELSDYVIETVDEGARICYRMNTSKYIKQFIETKVLNDLAENHSNQIFLQFVEKQMQFFNVPFHFLNNDQFYENLSIDLQRYCSQTIFPLFRFCKQINLVVQPHSQIVVKPGDSYNISFEKSYFSYKQAQYSFYLTILNNITKYQSHFVQVSINQPKLSISNLYINDHTVHSKKQLDQAHFKDRDWIKLLDKNRFRYQDDLQALNNIKAITIPIVINLKQRQNNTFIGKRVVSLKNNGIVPVIFTHFGLNQFQQSCNHQGLTINNNKCNQSLILEQGKQKNITLQFQIPQDSIQQYSKPNIYLYYQNNYYFRIQLVLKFPDIAMDHPSDRKAIYSLILNLISMLFIIFVILNRKKQNTDTIKQYDKSKKIKNKIYSRNSYQDLGSKIDTKKRKLDVIINEHILALKQHQQKKLKEFFNSSGESEIERKNPTEEDSNNNLLNSLRQPERNSVVLSEQSSIDLIDLNINNRSSQNAADFVEKDEVNSDDDQDSLFEEAGQIPQQEVVRDYGWGNEKEKKQKEKDKDASYYNVFLSQNPLKKEQQDPFHWMQRNNSNRQW